ARLAPNPGVVGPAQRARGRRLGVVGVQLGSECGEVGPPDLLGGGREYVVPDGGERADELRQPRRSSNEPPVEMLSAVSPAADMYSAELSQRADRAFDPRHQQAQLGCELVRKVAGLGEMRTRLEEHDERQAARLLEGEETPPFVRPEEVVVGRGAAA